MVNSLDLAVNSFMQSIQTPFLTKIMLPITDIGSAWTLIPLSILLVLFLLYKKRKQKAALTTSIIFSAIVLCEILKLIINRPRPSNALVSELITSSFPSWHAMMSVIFFIILILLFANEINNKITRYIFTSICIIIPILISFSRLYLNVHWLSDIIAGIIIGIFWTALFIRIDKQSTKRR